MSRRVDPRLLEVLEGLAPRALGPIQAQQRLIEDLGFDSVVLAQTVVAVEEAFGVELPQDRLHELRGGTVADVERLVAAGRGQP